MSQEPTIPTVEQGKTPAQLYGERAKRMADAGELKQPDRIPIMLNPGMFLAEAEGIPRQELYESADTAASALEKHLRQYEPDAYMNSWPTSGASRILGSQMTKYPGYGLGPHDSFQFHEGEYMKAEDYDAFLADPSDWSLRTYLPRTFTALQGLAMLPYLGMAARGSSAVNDFLRSLAQPQMASALEALSKAVQMQSSWSGKVIGHIQRLAALGYPPAPFADCGIITAPFDFMGDTLRGMRGIFLDMRRIPDKLLAAEEKVCQFQVQNTIARHKATGAKSVFIPLHRGSDGFISLPMFERFYWPQLKSMILQLVDAGLTPFVFWEGCWDNRVQYLAELPKGKTIGRFQQGNIFKIKEVVGNTMCILGGMPVSKLLSTEPSELREYTHKLCQEVGKGGGFIMSTDIDEMEGCNPELVKVWVDATKEFGKY